MAGFDLDTQYSYMLPGGGRGEAGYFDISNIGLDVSNTYDVPTRLTTIYHWNANAKDTHGKWINDIYTDGDVTGGAVTFTVETQRLDITMRIYYELKGW